MISNTPPDAPVWPVGALLQAVSNALQTRFGRVVVKGEVSGFTRAASGHCYFSIKDAQGQLRCAMFRRAAQASGLDMRDGQLVEATGHLDLYAARGELQMVVEGVRLAGQGSLFEQFLRLKAELEAEGCFDATRKRALPLMPRHVGVVTSLDAAALRDVVTTLRRRAPHVAVTVFPALVQGVQAPSSLLAALESVAKAHQQNKCDVLLVVRGGGSLEDLWAFNHPDLIRAMVRCPVPVVAGVGHETDFTLVDFVADVRAATPTAAAELCCTAQEVAHKALQFVQERLLRQTQRLLDWHAQGLDRMAQRLGRPREQLQRAQSSLQGRAHALRSRADRRLQAEQFAVERRRQIWEGAKHRSIEASHQHLDRLEARLRALDPTLVLQRGYAWLTDAQGHTLASTHDVELGQAVQAVLADGRLGLTVTHTGA
ncbi:MAG: exodeoxyribonuclease large subunit [Pseudomonadota bacterium]|jgi:exodeoxyribonuclease VII large subunit